jgi:hypothetical protein
MVPIIRFFAAPLLIGVCLMAPAPAAGENGASARPGHQGPVIQLGQAQTDEDRRREEDERRVKRRRRASRAEHEKLLRERARRASEDRRIRTERAVRELHERRSKEREARARRIQEGFETREERRRRARRARRLNADRSALSKRFPPAWVVGIIEGRVEKGWSADAVRESWGRPEKITPTAEGGEIWHYAAGRVVFSKGKVSDVVIAQPPPRPAPSPSGRR